MAKNKGKPESDTPKHAGGRPPKYNPALHPKIAMLCAEKGYTDKQTANFLEVSRAILYKWKNDYPEFLDALEGGSKDLIDDEAEKSLLRRVTGYKVREVTKERIADTGQKARHGGESALTQEQWEHAQSYFGNVCCYCGKSGKMTKDHVEPLHDGGELCADNVVPACQSCNSSKKDNNMDEWYESQSFYDTSKQDKIHAYIDMMHISVEDAGEMVVTKIVEKEVPPDVGAIKMWLGCRRKKVWREVQGIEGTIDMVDLTKTMTHEQKLARLKELTGKKD